MLVGHSLGGRIGTLFAGRHPDRMAGLVIVDSAPELDVRGTVRIRVDLQKNSEGGGASFASEAEYRDAARAQLPGRRVARRSRGWRTTGCAAATTAASNPNSIRRGSRAAARRAPTPQRCAQREERLTRDMWDALARVPCPTLVVRGAASDVLAPDVADRMVEEVLRHGRLAVIPRAGHSVMVDNPEAFRAALTGFVLGED